MYTWVLLNWVWTDGEAFLEIDQGALDENGSSNEKLMLMQSETGKVVKTPRLPPEDAYRTHGAWIAADGNQQKQLEVLKEKVTLWVDCIEKNR